MTDFLILPDGYDGHSQTKFIPVYEGLTGKLRLAVEGYQADRDPECVHYTTHSLAEVRRIHAMLGQLITRMEGQR